MSNTIRIIVASDENEAQVEAQKLQIRGYFISSLEQY